MESLLSFFRRSMLVFFLEIIVLYFLGRGEELLFLSLFYVWVRDIITQFRYNKLMYLAWKRFLPLSLTYLWQLNFVRRWHIIFVGSQKGVCSTSTSRSLEFSGGSYKFEKLLHSCLHSVDWLKTKCVGHLAAEFCPVHVMNSWRWNRRVTPNTITPCPRWTWAVSFTKESLYSRRNNQIIPDIHWIGAWGP
jgi:hypothetical protein